MIIYKYIFEYLKGYLFLLSVAFCISDGFKYDIKYLGSILLTNIIITLIIYFCFLLAIQNFLFNLINSILILTHVFYSKI